MPTFQEGNRGDAGAVAAPAAVRKVEVFEPGQNATVGWNKGKEVLVLATDIQASAETRVIEIMPFPSQPEVKKGRYVHRQTPATVFVIY